MIRARLSRGEGLRLEVKGHAGAGRYGEDVVCAAVSALVDTLAMGLARYDPGGRVTLQEGLFRYEGHPDRQAEAIIETFVMGLKDLAGTESQHVSFKEEE